jgi:adenine-specific DNA-methyltransferase
MEKLKLHTPDFTAQNIERVAQLFPNCVTETQDEQGHLTRAIDFDQLRQELSGSIVEGPRERDHLDWPGTREAILAANAPIAKTLRPSREESVDFDTTKNLFIEGDNLDALKLLQETYLGKVKLIYIDPPYNTGNDYIYNDYFSESNEAYLARSNQKDEGGNRMVANTDSNGKFHSDWLSMLYPRLKLARNLLSADGAVFISIDDNEIANLRLICDEVFGPNNFLGIIAVVSNLKGRSDDKYFATAHNYALAYSKGHFKTQGVPLPEEYLEEYDEQDSSGRRYRLQGLRKRGTGARRVDRPKMFYPFYVNSGGESISLEKTTAESVEVLPRLSDGTDGRWRWGKETAASRLDELTARTVGPNNRWDIFQIDYALPAGDEKRIRPKSFWIGSEFANESGTLEVKELMGKGVFDNPKPVGLLRYILEQAIGENDAIVLDFFAGSGTTAHAIIEFNAERKLSARFICVQLAEQIEEGESVKNGGYKTIADIAKERIRRAGSQIKSETMLTSSDLDAGFRVLKIDTSNMREVYYTPDAVAQANLLGQVDNIRADRTPEDLLFQILVDWGLDLALPVAHEAIAGKTVFFVDGNALAACFDSGVTDELVKEIAKRKPLRAVFRDASYGSDSVKINVDQIFRLLSPETEVRSI